MKEVDFVCAAELEYFEDFVEEAEVEEPVETAYIA